MTLARDPLLTAILVEGAADFIAQLVTGEEPDTARAAWAAPREADLWRQMQADIALTRQLTDKDDPEEGSPEAKAYARWIGNYSTPPAGWPPELGYWMGLRIWQRYYAAAPDKHAALRAMLAVRDPRAILPPEHTSAAEVPSKGDEMPLRLPAAQQLRYGARQPRSSIKRIHS